MADVQIGASAERTLLVTGEVAISFLGDESARVLATPFLIAQLELTARDAILPFVEDGRDSVGTRVDVKHLAATPVGMSVTFHAEVTGVDRRRVTFRVWAEDEREKISEGTHERFVIDVERFGARLKAKTEGE
ncbi:MAG: thioesterase family protein [bacterium]|nr:thioesterase family protein [bacterium]